MNFSKRLQRLAVIRLPLSVAIAMAGNALGPAAAADICKYEDAEGRVTFSNVPVKNAKKLACFESPAPAPPPKQKQKNKGPADFPKVDAGAQKSRDDVRRKILSEELSAEQARLEQARQALEQGRQEPEVYEKQVTVTGPDGKPRVVTQTFRDLPKYEEKIRRLEADVARHERNVEALNKEMEFLK